MLLVSVIVWNLPNLGVALVELRMDRKTLEAARIAGVHDAEHHLGKQGRCRQDA